jgi:prepilin-type N-terminal cleavage/methylation domain-containing protein
MGTTRKKSGFTLIEVLVALSVAAILGVTISGLVIGQQRFYRHADATIVSQQNMRAALDLMTAEIRMASPTDLIAATPDSVAFRADLIRAVVCDSTGPDEVTLFVYDTVTTMNLGIGFRGAAFSGPYDSAFVYADSWTPSVGAVGSAAEAVCVANGAPAGMGTKFYRRVTGWGSQFADVPDRGSVVRFYGRLSYRFGGSNFSNGNMAIWRNSQELVSPFATGAAFQYVMADGSVRTSVPGPQLADVASVRIIASTMGNGPDLSGVRNRAILDVPLRN